jgi:hypothetical protein
VEWGGGGVTLTAPCPTRPRTSTSSCAPPPPLAVAEPVQKVVSSIFYLDAIIRAASFVAAFVVALAIANAAYVFSEFRSRKFQRVWAARSLRSPPPPHCAAASLRPSPQIPSSALRIIRLQRTSHPLHKPRLPNHSADEYLLPLLQMDVSKISHRCESVRMIYPKNNFPPLQRLHPQFLRF